MRGLNQLNTTIYATSYGDVDEIYGGNYFNEKLFSAFSINDTITFFVDTSTQNEIEISKNYLEITLFKVCPKCSLVAFTGIIQNQTPDNNIVIQDLVDTQKNQIVVPAGCAPSLLALSYDGTLLSWSCPDRIGLYDSSKNTVRFLNVIFTNILSL